MVVGLVSGAGTLGPRSGVMLAWIEGEAALEEPVYGLAATGDAA